jgi:hypothetical protein
VEAVVDVVRSGGTIVTGGALGVDMIATQAVLGEPGGDRAIKVILPTPLAVYAAHYRMRAQEGVITTEVAEELVALLERLERGGALWCLEGTACTEETYYARNSAVLAHSDELYAFWVNGSDGTKDTIDKARALGMACTVWEYSTEL